MANTAPALVCCVLIFFCVYAAYDLPAALVLQLREELKLSQTQFALLYAVPGAVGVFLSLTLSIHGLKHLGVSQSMVLFSALAFGGQAAFAVGVERELFWLAVCGRAAVAAGRESLLVALQTLLVMWYPGGKTTVFAGVTLCAARMGTVASFLGAPAVLSYAMRDGVTLDPLAQTAIFSAGVAAVAFLAAIALAVVGVACRVAPPSRPPPLPERISASKACALGGEFWLLALSGALLYGCVLSFAQVASALLQDNYFGTACLRGPIRKTCRQDATHDANVLLSIPFAIAAVFSPFLVGGVERIGKRSLLVAFAALVTAGAFALLRVTAGVRQEDGPEYATMLLGLCYAVFGAALWPAIATAVKRDQLSTAYAVAGAVQQLSLTVGPLAVGAAYDYYGSWRPVEIGLISVCALAFLLAMLSAAMEKPRAPPSSERLLGNAV